MTINPLTALEVILAVTALIWVVLLLAEITYRHHRRHCILCQRDDHRRKERAREKRLAREAHKAKQRRIDKQLGEGYRDASGH